MELSKTLRVEIELTNISSGPKKRGRTEAIVSESGVVVLKHLRGDLFTIRIVEGPHRFIAPAQVTIVEKNRTNLIWINLLDSDRKQLAEILGAPGKALAANNRGI